MYLYWVHTYLPGLYPLVGLAPLGLCSVLFVSCYDLCFEVYFARYKYCYPSFSFVPFAWNTIFQPSTFSLWESFVLRWVSWRQHIYGSYFLISPATLCLLIGAFNPFTFKAIIVGTYLLPFFPLKKDFIYLLLESGEGKEKERDRNINVWEVHRISCLLHAPRLGTWPTTKACALTGNPTGDLSVCRAARNPLSHTIQGAIFFFLTMFLSLSISSCQSSSFNISCNACLVVMNSFNLSLSGKLFILPSVLNDCLAGWSSLGFRSLLFISLNTLCQSFLACSAVTEPNR